MKKISETIVFFGSGPVAAQSLQLLAQDFSIEAVVTKPRPLHHKGDVPVLRTAEQLNIPIFTVASKKSLDSLLSSTHFASKLGVLVDFGIIVSQKVIDYFEFGIINSHFSLLPELRGADPITFSILSGQPVTGVSIMLLTAGMDEGPILSYAEHKLSARETAPELTEELIDLSYALLQIVIPLYLDGQLVGVAQDDRITPTYSHKLTKENGLLDWHKSAAQLEREIRAFIEWPKSHTRFGKLDVIVTKAHVVALKGPVGARSIEHGQPIVFCREGALVLDAVKPAGKKEMPGAAFLAGYKNIFLNA